MLISRPAHESVFLMLRFNFLLAQLWFLASRNTKIDFFRAGFAFTFWFARAQVARINFWLSRGVPTSPISFPNEIVEVNDTFWMIPQRKPHTIMIKLSKKWKPFRFPSTSTETNYAIRLASYYFIGGMSKCGDNFPVRDVMGEIYVFIICKRRWFSLKLLMYKTKFYKLIDSVAKIGWMF